MRDGHRLSYRDSIMGPTQVLMAPIGSLHDVESVAYTCIYIYACRYMYYIHINMHIYIYVYEYVYVYVHLYLSLILA